MKNKAVILIILTMGLISCSTNKQVEKLFLNSKALKNRTYYHEQLSGLPKPVQAYFRYALEDRQPYLSQLRLKQNQQGRQGAFAGRKENCGMVIVAHYKSNLPHFAQYNLASSIILVI